MSALGILVFARMNSTRLPGKVLLDFAGMPLILWIMRRASLLPFPIALACSHESSDDALAGCVQNAGFTVYRGALDDVLARAIAAAEHLGWRQFARLCGDRPFFDVEQMQAGLTLMQAWPELDLISNQFDSPAIPGLTTEVVSLSALKRVACASLSSGHREHLTSYLMEHRTQFLMKGLPGSEMLSDRSGMHSTEVRFAIDTPADYEYLTHLAAGQTPGVVLAAVLNHVQAAKQ